MTLYHVIIYSIKARLFISIHQADNDNHANLEVYQRLEGKLIYLTCGIRSDICFMIGLLSQYNFDPKAKHFCIAK